MRSVKLLIEAITGKKFEINVQPEETIENVKGKIAKRAGMLK